MRLIINNKKYEVDDESDIITDLLDAKAITPKEARIYLKIACLEAQINAEVEVRHNDGD